MGEVLITVNGSFLASEAKVAVVISRFNRFINDSLLSGALDGLMRCGKISENNIHVVWVPGAYEIPIAINSLLKTQKYDGIVALGTVIRGSTAHFDFVAGEASSGILKTSLEYNIPVSFGVLTTDTIEQAIERAGTKAGNKGNEAALTVLEMIDVLKQIKEL